MANRRNGSDRNSTGRSRLASLLLALMPGFMFLGLLAPGAVIVEEEQEEEVELPLVFRDFQLPTREPLLGDHVTVDAGATEVAAIRDVLTAGVPLIHRAKDSLEVIDFELQAKEDIVLESDAAEDEVVQKLLDPATTPAVSQNVLIAETNQLLDNDRFGIIPGPLRTGGERQDDDFAGEALVFKNPVPQPVEVPEPTSGALLALGLAGIAVSRRTGVLSRA